MERESFIFYKDWYNIIVNLDSDMQLNVLKAIINFAFNNEIPADPIVNAITGLMQSAINRDNEKYYSTIKKRKAAGEKGNQIRWESQKVANVANANFAINEIAMRENISQTVANVADNVNDNVNDIIKKESIKEKKTAAEAATNIQNSNLEKRKQEFYKQCAEYVPKYGKEMVRAFFDYWTEKNRSETKMRYELEKTFEISKRLATWAKRDYNIKKNENGNYNSNSKFADPRESLAAIARGTQYVPP